MKVKIFQTRSQPSSNREQLETEINEWLEKEKPDVINILQSDTRSAFENGGHSRIYLTITFLYR